MTKTEQAALRRYVVFRIKAMEFLDLNGLHHSLRQLGNAVVPLPEFPPFRPGSFVSDSVRTAVIGWLALFIDHGDGMNVLSLWKTLFKEHAGKVDAAWPKIEPGWQIMHRFRNRAGFHADKPVRFFDARFEFRSGWPQMQVAFDEFRELLMFFLKAEAKELPGLEAELDSLLDELEKRHGAKFQREQFKAYMMIGGK